MSEEQTIKRYTLQEQHRLALGVETAVVLESDLNALEQQARRVAELEAALSGARAEMARWRWKPTQTQAYIKQLRDEKESLRDVLEQTVEELDAALRRAPVPGREMMYVWAGEVRDRLLAALTRPATEKESGT